METQIPLSNIYLTEREKLYARDALDNGWISGTGNYIQRFEDAISEKINRKHCIAVANGTLALELALQALGIGPGDEVIVPAFTFVTPAAVVKMAGAIPVFADIHEGSWTLDPGEVYKQITNKTKAIIAVDLLGHPCDFYPLLDLGIPVIEDAAEAHGAWYHHEPVGSFGIISTFSFHASKTVATGEGGCVATDNDDLYPAMKLMANHGMTGEKPYCHPVIGHNYRMTNLIAAIGLGQVERWDELVTARNNTAQTYDKCLAGLEIERRPVAPWATEACWLYSIATQKRKKVLMALQSEGVDARAIWAALPNLPLYTEGCRGDYPIASRVAETAILLPTWADMPIETIEYIAGLIRGSLTC